MPPKYPFVQVELPPDGHAPSIVARVHLALRRAGVPAREINAYLSVAVAADYNELLEITSRTVSIIGPANRVRAA